jgi:hypothetical protein
LHKYDAGSLDEYHRIKASGVVLDWKGVPTIGTRQPCKVTAAKQYIKNPALDENVIKRAWCALMALRLVMELVRKTRKYKVRHRLLFLQVEPLFVIGS